MLNLSCQQPRSTPEVLVHLPLSELWEAMMPTWREGEGEGGRRGGGEREERGRRGRGEEEERRGRGEGEERKRRGRGEREERGRRGRRGGGEGGEGEERER